MRGWVQAALEIYPADVVGFYGKEKNSFANPVGAATAEGIEGLFDALVADAPPGEFVPHLDRILQVRCVQGFPPSQATWFIFALKGVIRDALAGELKDAAALRTVSRRCPGEIGRELAGSLNEKIGSSVSEHPNRRYDDGNVQGRRHRA